MPSSASLVSSASHLRSRTQRNVRHSCDAMPTGPPIASRSHRVSDAHCSVKSQGLELRSNKVKEKPLPMCVSSPYDGGKCSRASASRQPALVNAPLSWRTATHQKERRRPHDFGPRGFQPRFSVLCSAKRSWVSKNAHRRSMRRRPSMALSNGLASSRVRLISPPRLSRATHVSGSSARLAEFGPAICRDVNDARSKLRESRNVCTPYNPR